MKRIQGKCLKKSVLFLTVGMIFLANPVWTLTDLLPDLIGWLLIWAGLRELASSNDSATVARRYALYLAAIGGLKLFGQYLLSGSRYSSDSMLAALLFCGGEIACMLLFFGAFLRGAEELSRAGGCDEMYLGSGDARFFCGLFVWTRGLCTFLPELVAIPDWLVKYGDRADGGSSTASLSENGYRLLKEIAGSKELFFVIFSTIELIVAVVWLIKFLPYLRLFRTDETLNGFLAERLHYESGARDRSARIGSLRMAKRFVWIAIAFLADVQIDGVRVLPVGMFPLVLAAACLALDSFEGARKRRGTAGLFALSGLVLFAAELYRRFGTVWDMRAYEEQTFPTEVISAFAAICAWTFLLWAWLDFSRTSEEFAASNVGRTVDLDGLPYFLLVLYGAVFTLSFALPIWNRFLTVPKLALMAGLWLTAARRYSMLNEETETRLSLYKE